MLATKEEKKERSARVSCSAGEISVGNSGAVVNAAMMDSDRDGSCGYSGW